MRIAPSLLLLTLASCGDNQGADPGDVRSGSRLKLVRQAYADGTLALVAGRYVDTVLDAECAPTGWSDGYTYCAPPVAETVFEDAECLRLRGQVPHDVNGSPPETPRFFVRRFQLGDEALPSRLYARKGPVGAPAQVWQLRDGVRFGPSSPGIVADYYSLDEVEPAQIYQLEVDVDERLAVVVQSSDDGMHVPVSWRDRQLEATCRADGAPPSGLCTPTDATDATFFLDDRCRAPAIAVRGDASKVARFQDPETRCTTHHALGAAITDARLYTRVGPSCVPADVPPLHLVYPLAETVELAGLARASEPTEGDRLVALTSTVAGVHVVDETLHDATLATACRPAIVEGAVRCVPIEAASVSAYFTEDTCTVRGSFATVPASGCTSSTFAIDDEARVRRVEAPYAGALFERDAEGRCLPVGAAANTLFTLGAPLVDELATSIGLVVVP